MLDDECLVFVEVRYRNEASFVKAAVTVDSRKQRKLTLTASMFLSTHRTFGNRVCRFDVVGVDRDARGKISIDWMRDAFRPSSAWISAFESRGSLDSPTSKMAEFNSKYRLIGVYSSQGSRYAIIAGKKNNVILAIDEEIDGFKLISVDDRLAVLQNQELTVVLELPEKH